MKAENSGLISVKIYHVSNEFGEQTVIAACDVKYLGKIFREKELILDVNREFYSGELYTVEEAIKLLRTGTILNLVGEQIINAAIKEGLVHKDAIIRISGVPHAQVVRI